MSRVGIWLLRHGRKVIVVADTLAELGRLAYRVWLGPSFPGYPHPWRSDKQYPIVKKGKRR